MGRLPRVVAIFTIADRKELFISLGWKNLDILFYLVSIPNSASLSADL